MWKLVKEYIKAIIIAILISIFIRTFIVQAFKIPSGSMKPTLQIGDHILVNKFFYGVKFPYLDNYLLSIHSPKRGDIIVFLYPQDKTKAFIKRVIAVAGDKIEIKNKKIIINNLKIEDKFCIYDNKSPFIPGKDNMNFIKVPKNRLFVMGDNRDHSYDSRFWGFVDLNDILGKAFLIYWSWDHEKNSVRWERIGNIIQ